MDVHIHRPELPLAPSTKTGTPCPQGLDTKRSGRILNGQSKVLPCVFTGSDVSATPQRLWPGARWTITVQGPKRESIWCTCVQQAQTAPRSRQGERTKRPPLPSPLGLRRGQGPLQTSGRASRRTPGKQVPVNSNSGRRNGNTWTQALLARDELDGWPTCVRNVVEIDKRPRVAPTQ